MLKPKKILCLLICVIICFAVCSCSSKNASTENVVKRTTASNTKVKADKAISEKVMKRTTASNTKAEAKVDLDIIEECYVTYINDVYNNYKNYLGKVIRLQGMFKAETYDYNGSSHTVYYVYRTGPGCCGNDGSMCGFEFTYNGALPTSNDWIEVTGTLNSYEENKQVFLTLDASSCKVMSVRGKENVNQ